MASRGYGPVIRQVGRLLGGSGTATGLGDGSLLRRFADHRDGAAFEALVARHGPMVLATCRRMLVDPRDVEDAFQATFLVLARKAGSIRDAERLGPWLHGVARRVAGRSRALAARRDARERPGAEDRAITRPDPVEAVELRSALDEELARLPEKYRAPLVLCYLEGLTHDEAAMQLSWPVGTVRSRLAGGRDRLRSRLTRRGLSPSATVPAILPTPAIPEALMSATIRVATAAGSTPARVATLAKGVLIAMMWNKLKVIGAVGLMAGLTVGGAGALAQQGGDGKAGDQPAAPEPARPKTPRIDALQGELNQAARDVNRLKGELNQAARDANRLRAELKAAEEKLAALKVKIGDSIPDPVKAAEVPKKAEPETDADSEIGKADQSASREGPPTVMGISDGTVLVISGKHDRATVLDTKTGERKTCRFPGNVTSLTPIVSPSMLAFMMSGPDIRRVAVFDSEADAWSSVDLLKPANGQISPSVGGPVTSYVIDGTLYAYSGSARRWGVMEGSTRGTSRYFGKDVGGNNLIAPAFRGQEIKRIDVMEIDSGRNYPQDLREPASGELFPVAIHDGVAYQAGRFVYVFSSAVKSWSVLELKKADPVLNTGTINNIQAGKLVIPDGDFIHLYDAKAGEWTHIDLNEE